MRAFFIALSMTALISGSAAAESVSVIAKRWMALFAAFSACTIHDDPYVSEYEMKAILQKMDSRFRERFGVRASDIVTFQKASSKTLVTSDCDRVDRTMASIIAGGSHFGSF